MKWDYEETLLCWLAALLVAISILLAMDGSRIARGSRSHVEAR